MRKSLWVILTENALSIDCSEDDKQKIRDLIDSKEAIEVYPDRNCRHNTSRKYSLVEPIGDIKSILQEHCLPEKSHNKVSSIESADDPGGHPVSSKKK